MTAISAMFTTTTLDFTMIKLEWKVPDISSKTLITIEINSIAKNEITFVENANRWLFLE